MFCVAPPELETKMNITKGGLVLFSANSNSSCMELSKKIAERLGVELGKVQVYQEPNRGELPLTRAMLICVRNVTYWLSPPSSTPATARLSVS